MTEPTVEQGSMNMLHFHIGDMHFCVSLAQASRVLPLVALQQLPDAPDYIAGLMNLHGRSVPVVDLIYRLNLPYKRSYNTDACIILCQVDDKTVGLIADDVDHVGSADHAMVQLQSLFNCNTPPLLGLVESKLGMAAWLALEPILDFDFSLPDGHVADDYHQILSALSDQTP
ncbi:MAG: hypothetical protein AUJ57_01470 [Zetaproteobacteria bacterium CG1_02_53_45]|nr:MAG: hypothetical protein AUJ57_01470 [Zetaproteobacteria bacterium CG1_02_53_45]